MIVPIDTPNIKACVTCQHLRGNRTYATDAMHWECFKAPIGIDLITGKKMYELCTGIRCDAEKCGPEGKWYTEYEVSKNTANAMDTDVPVTVRKEEQATPGPGKKVKGFSLDI